MFDLSKLLISITDKKWLRWSLFHFMPLINNWFWIGEVQEVRHKLLGEVLVFWSRGQFYVTDSGSVCNEPSNVMMSWPKSSWRQITEGKNIYHSSQNYEIHFLGVAFLLKWRIVRVSTVGILAEENLSGHMRCTFPTFDIAKFWLKGCHNMSRFQKQVGSLLFREIFSAYCI